jgi:hypothetical protein
MTKKSNHRIAEYRARDNYVECTCGKFSGTVEAYYKHKSVEKATGAGTLKFLDDLNKNRWDYYHQGHLSRTGHGYGD